MNIKGDKIGEIRIRTLALPEQVRRPSATYTFSGKILVDYHCDADPDAKDYIHLAVMNDDSSDFRDIFEGLIPRQPRANGIRFMPFQDNTRILLGDYILECSPDIDHCQQCQLIPVIYPWNIKDDERVFRHWSEIIISPDNRHICWTLLKNGGGAAVLIGSLARDETNYIINNTQIISSDTYIKENPEKEGYLLPGILRGGEVKQFVHGGSAVSMVGAKDSALADSVIQDLVSEETIQITKTPGYEETTILSPDEQLGIVMSTRFSPKTNLAIIGLLPRPYSHLTAGNMIATAYLYSVAAVRTFRHGNIGPVLIDLERSMNEPEYQGKPLFDPEEKWVYYSPMSWHPSAKKALWPEGLRGTQEKRIQIVELPDYEPCAVVPTHHTPDHILYGSDDCTKLWETQKSTVSGKIAGKFAGHISYHRDGNFARSDYVQMSDDGENYYQGYVLSAKNDLGEVMFEADLVQTGEKSGRMDLRLTFSAADFSGDCLPRLLSGIAQDGKPMTYGYAEYDGLKITVESLLEK